MIKLNGTIIEFGKFPNGETRLLTNMKPLVSYDNVVNFRYQDDSDLIKLMFVKKYIDAQVVRHTMLFIDYMPYSRMDRSENGSLFTLKYVSEFINSLGFCKINIIEPHSDVTCALLNNSRVNYINYDLIEKVVDILDFDRLNDYLVFPDAGAQKRYSKLVGYNTLVGNKTRDFGTGKITGLEIIGSYYNMGKKAVIVDDLSSYGGTFVETSKKLKEIGFEKVYLLVAHAENNVFEGELFDHIDKLFTTDSIISKQDYWENKRFKDKLHIFNLEDVVDYGY